MAKSTPMRSFSVRSFERLEPRVVLDSHGLVISEFMAANKNTLQDQDTESSDWIEIHNVSDESIDLADWHLTDKTDELAQWKFPTQQLESGEYLLVFASGKDRAEPDAELHTNFKLKSAGEYLALSDPLGVVRSSYAPLYPTQSTDVSYGINVDGQSRYFDVPTPGAANGTGIQIATEVEVSHESGFYDEAFDLILTTSDAAGQVRYTTDGSKPTEMEGIDFVEPISILGSTVIRAAAFRDGFEPSPIATRTFLFLDDVIQQSNESAESLGFPAKWEREGGGPFGGNSGADYEMDQSVIGQNGSDDFDGVYANTIREDLKSIASISLVMDQDDFLGSKGIYSNPTERGKEFEKSVNGEIIDPDKGSEVQFDSGIRLQGGISRVLATKNSFRLTFRPEYGEGTLKHPVFGENSSSEINSITLRSSGGESFVGVHYIRDTLVRRSQLATGGAASRGRFLHVYINGLYWGVYEAVERPDSQFMVNHYGGERDNWDVLNAGDLGDEKDTAIDGDIEAWERLIDLTKDLRRARGEQEREAIFLKLQGKNPDGTLNPDFENLLDIDNYIDYLLTNWHAANGDWPHRNYYMGRDKGVDSTGFKFVSWDAEFTMQNDSCPSVASFAEERGPGVLYQGLFKAEGFQVRMADRIQKHFSPGGAFYVNEDSSEFNADRPEDNIPAARYQEIVDAFVQPLVAESARWGDGMRGFGQGDDSLTRDESWLPQVAENMKFLASRSATLLKCFARADVHRQAPTFSESGTAFPTAANVVTLEADVEKIYFTTDGSDPRNPDGSIGETATEYSEGIDIPSTVKISTRSLDDDGKWSAIQSHTYLVSNQPDASSLRLSEIHYHPGDPTDAERAAGFTDAEEFEFIEFFNTSDTTIDLTDAELVQTTTLNQESGVGFRFPTGSQLGPRGTTVIVENAEAFRARYGSDIPIAGEWQGKLDNSDETIRLALNGLAIHQVSYEDHWHPETDGVGKSLEIIDATNLDLQQWNRAAGWAASVDKGGTPGRHGSSLPGDFDANGQVDGEDIDAIFAAVRSGTDESSFDLNLDGEVSTSDVDYLVTGPILGTLYGDVNLDGEVNFADFLVMAVNFGHEGGWDFGDQDGDAKVGFSDFLVLSSTFGQKA